MLGLFIPPFLCCNPVVHNHICSGWDHHLLSSNVLNRSTYDISLNMRAPDGIDCACAKPSPGRTEKAIMGNCLPPCQSNVGINNISWWTVCFTIEETATFHMLDVAANTCVVHLLATDQCRTSKTMACAERGHLLISYKTPHQDRHSSAKHPTSMT
jgi:hypothetical protein